MKENDLTIQQKEQISLLLEMIREQSTLFSKQEPMVVKIPFDTLKESSINKAKARYFIQYLNQHIGEINPESIWINILNGTITKIGNEIVSQTEEDINPVSGVYLEDDEDSLILEIYNWKLFLKKAGLFLNLDFSKPIIKSIDKNNGNIILQISEERKEIICNKFKHSFRKATGANKRFEYLIKIYKNPKIGGSDLGSSTLQNVSKELKKLNVIIKNKLKLSDDLIINNGNSGYEINNKYKIEFI